MAPWEGLTTEDGGLASGEGAFSFISKSFGEAQKIAESDMKLMKSRVQSLIDLRATIDKEWESLMKSPSFNEATKGLDSALQTFLVSSKGSTHLPIFSVNPSKPSTATTMKKVEVGGEKSMVVRRRSSSQQGWRKLCTRVNEFNWEPLQRVKRTVHKSLVDTETTTAATTTKTPADFLQNVKKNLDNVVPPNLPQLFEKFSWPAEPFLNDLECKKDDTNMGDYLSSCKHKVDQLSSSLALKGKELGVVGKALAGDLFSRGLINLDLRIANVIQSTRYCNKGGVWGGDLTPAKQVTEDTTQNIAIFTTASLPWMTGTAVNPLFRAAYLAKSGKKNVTLLVPWLCKKDQEQVYPNRMTFESPEEQETFVRGWLENRVGFKSDFKIAFYPGKFSTEKRSILAAGDISEFIPDQEADVAVLEEPEHLTWYYHGKRWTDKFQHVVGVVHTNYLEYVKREKNGKLQAFLLKYVNNWVVRIYCTKVLRLSAATQVLPKSLVCNVHGVSPKFLDIGKQLASESEEGRSRFSKGAYYLGKMIWGKGYRELVDLLAQNKEVLDNTPLDVFGTGEDSQAVQAEARAHGLRMNFHEGRDHADVLLHGYKVFINPSLSDVVCTTTAEALAMGKIVVCADHPSNDFFRPFPNCLMYKTPDEFVEKVKLALASEPLPLSPELQHLLSWEAATERFINCAELDSLPPRGTKGPGGQKKMLSRKATNRQTMTLSLSLPKIGNIIDRGLAFTHYFLSGIEAARWAAGALPGTMHIDEQHRKDLGLPASAAKSFFRR